MELTGLNKPRPLMANNPKARKKNTLYRNLRALDLRTDHRQRQCSYLPKTKDETSRICTNCGEHYTGRICPQCGQAGTWARFTWRQTFLNFLDIWGLGNRPMYRTLHDLFWRPGYMIRDYLDGHRQYYFPPFKLLAVTIALLLLTSWLTGAEVNSVFKMFAPNSETDLGVLRDNVNDIWSLLKYLFKKFSFILSRNPLYEYLFIGCGEVVCIWIAFRRVSRFNLVETYIFILFVLSQNLLLNIPNMMCSGAFDFLSAHMATSPVNQSLLDMVEYMAMAVFTCLAFLFMVLDFKQFYGLTWKSTLLRLWLSLTILPSIAGAVAVIIFLFVKGETLAGFYSSYMFLLVLVAFFLADNCLKANKKNISRTVSRATKLAMLSVLLSPIISFELFESNYNIPSHIALITCYCVIAFVLSISPIVIYKRYNNNALSLLLLPLLIVLFSFFFTL